MDLESLQIGDLIQKIPVFWPQTVFAVIRAPPEMGGNQLLWNLQTVIGFEGCAAISTEAKGQGTGGRSDRQ